MIQDTETLKFAMKAWSRLSIEEMRFELEKEVIWSSIKRMAIQCERRLEGTFKYELPKEDKKRLQATFQGYGYRVTLHRGYTGYTIRW